MATPSNLKLVLASASPRRRELLSSVGLRFTVDPADIPESRNKGESPVDYVTRLAREKAIAVRSRYSTVEDQNILILAADTIVVDDLNGVGEHPTVLEKPVDYNEAVTMWSALGGSSHTVITAVCINSSIDLIKGGEALDITDDAALNIQRTEDPSLAQFATVNVSTAVRSTVEMGVISRDAMARYWATGEPQDKSGAYGMQGLASAWVRSISGSPSNIVGLPLFETNHLLSPYGLNWL